MSKASTVLLEEIMAPKLGSVDPSKYPGEEFDLYSIPAFDAGEPEVLEGKEIGSAKQIVSPGDVLLSRIVPHIRRAWIVGDSRGRRIIASGEWIVFRGERFDSSYLRHVLVGDPFHAEFMRTVSGVGGSLLRARPAYVAKIRIPLPPLPEQRRIAEILDKADALRAKRRAALDQLDTLTQSIFLDMFGDPATNPKGWPTRKFDETIRDETSRAEKLQRSDYLPEGRFPVVDQGQSVIAGYCDDQQYLCPSETPVVVFGDHTRAVKLVRHPFVVGADGAKVLVPQPGVDSVFLAYLLRALPIPNLGYSRHMREVKRLTFPVPRIERQQHFVQRIASVELHREAHGRSQLGMDSLFASLQYRAFRGEL